MEQDKRRRSQSAWRLWLIGNLQVVWGGPQFPTNSTCMFVFLLFVSSFPPRRQLCRLLISSSNSKSFIPVLYMYFLDHIVDPICGFWSEGARCARPFVALYSSLLRFPSLFSSSSDKVRAWLSIGASKVCDQQFSKRSPSLIYHTDDLSVFSGKQHSSTKAYWR